MKVTDFSLLEQMRLTESHISGRKELFFITSSDAAQLLKVRPLVDTQLDALVDHFYELQTANPEVALLIGDSDTLRRLRSAQHSYILDLFSGVYDVEYVNSRLRIGMIHKRIGVEPRLYLSAISMLRRMLVDVVRESIKDEKERAATIDALQKLIMFDISLVVDTYIRSMLSEIETAREKSENYARVLEEKIRERTLELETLSRTDSLTGLFNRHHLNVALTQSLRTAKRRDEPLTLAYVDVDGLKLINDKHGHQVGDRLLKDVAKALKYATRSEDYCFRLGGDEFCVILNNCDLSRAKEKWEGRVKGYLQKQEFRPNVSIGYAQSGPGEHASPEPLIQEADAQMYKAKSVRTLG